MRFLHHRVVLRRKKEENHQTRGSVFIVSAELINYGQTGEHASQQVAGILRIITRA